MKVSVDVLFLELKPLRGETNFKPRPQNMTLDQQFPQAPHAWLFFFFWGGGGDY